MVAIQHSNTLPQTQKSITILYSIFQNKKVLNPDIIDIQDVIRALTDEIKT